MVRAKDGIGPMRSCLATCLAASFSLIGAGCTTMSGLRSVGVEHPTFLGFWGRARPRPPAPPDDYYAQTMQTARERAGTTSRRAEAPPVRTAGAGDPARGLPDDQPLGSVTRTDSTRGAGSMADPAPAATVRVTLGRPEPSPPLSTPMARATRPASTRPKSAATEDPRVSGADPSPEARQVRDPGGRPDPVVRASASHDGGRDSPNSKDARVVLARSEARLRSLATYQVRMTRVERVGGRLQPEERILLSIRRDPRAVRLEWADGPNQGREVIYSSRLDPQALFVHMPSGAIPLPTLKLAVDNPMVAKNSRHSIAEAGFDTILENLRKSMERKDPQSPEPGQLVYQGLEKAPGIDRHAHCFVRHSPAGVTWTIYVDATTMLPGLVIAKDSSGDLIERYIYQEVRENPAELASAEAFDPDRRWGPPQGLLSRFARAGNGVKSPNTGQSPASQLPK
jgi:hypothetical protein